MKRKFFLGLLLGCSLALQAQMESHLTYRRYTTQDGLPQMQTERLWQDARGYIYIGTLSGFVRFDGRTFTPFLKGRRENIVAFAEVEGRVRGLGFRRQWLVDGDEAELRPIDPQEHWQLNNLNAGSLPDGYVLLEDEQEQHRRLCWVEQRSFRPVLTDPLLDEMTPDRKLYVDSLATLVPTQGGLYLPRNGQQAERLTDKGDVYTLLRADTALLAFASDGLYSLKQEGTWKATRVLEADWTAAAFGLTVRRLHGGGLVIADEHTVYCYDGAALQQVVTGINLIRDVLVDRWDRLWVATYQGVYCFFNRCFTNHRLTDRNDIVRALAADGDGRLVMGTLNGKVLRGTRSMDQGAGDRMEFAVISDNPSEYYGTSAVAIGRQVLMPCHGDVACVEPSDTLALRSLGLPFDRYRFLTRHDRKLITVSQHCVIAAYDPATAQLDTLTTEIPYPWCAAFDDEGRLWAGGTMGVYSLGRGGEVKKADFPQKLLVTTMEADSRGTIFFASADSLFMIRKGKVSPLPVSGQANGGSLLAGHEVRSLHVSPRGYLVVAAVDGLLLCRIGSDYQCSDAQFFDHRNGFTMLEPLMASMAETSDGTVWLAGVEEMASFRPEELLAYSEEDTFIRPLPRWWQHWWVWLSGLALFAVGVWAVTRGYEKRRSRKKMIRLQRQKLEKERQLETIRQKAIEADSTELAKDIVRMTEKTDDDRLTFRTATGTLVVEKGDIAYFKGDGNYSLMVAFHVQETVLMGLGALEKMLDPEIFVRADRSTLVNILNISSLQPKQRRCVFRSANGQEVEAKLLAPAFKRLQQLL